MKTFKFASEIYWSLEFQFLNDYTKYTIRIQFWKVLGPNLKLGAKFSIFRIIDCQLAYNLEYQAANS